MLLQSTHPHADHIDEQESELPPDWALIDTWRSIWEALAIVAGDDPERARAGHIRYCARLTHERSEKV